MQKQLILTILFLGLTIVISTRSDAQNNILPNWHFENGTFPNDCNGFEGAIGNWVVAGHNIDEDNGTPPRWIDITVGNCDTKRNELCGWYLEVSGEGTQHPLVSNLSSNRFVQIRQYAESYNPTDETYTNSYHNAITAQLTEQLEEGATYVIRMKVMACSLPVANEASGKNHLRVFFTEKGGNNWNDNINNQQFEAINANIVIQNNGTDCQWYQTERRLTIPTGNNQLNHIVLFMEEGQYAIDDIEMYKVCPDEMLIQHKTYEHTYFYPYLNYSYFYEATVIKAGNNVGAPGATGDVFVQDDADITYIASDYIELLPGFSALAINTGFGVNTFTAQIGTCNDAMKRNVNDKVQEPINNGTNETQVEKENQTIKSIKNPVIQINVYTIPSTGIINVELNNINIGQTEISIFNYLGEKIACKNSGLEEKNTFDLSNNADGWYFVKIMDFTNQKIYTHRVNIVRYK